MQCEGGGLFLDSTKTLEPACSVLSEQLAENDGNVFSGRRGGSPSGEKPPWLSSINGGASMSSSSLLESTKSL
jgi:hypothetical protein